MYSSPISHILSVMVRTASPNTPFLVHISICHILGCLKTAMLIAQESGVEVGSSLQVFLQFIHSICIYLSTLYDQSLYFNSLTSFQTTSQLSNTQSDNISNLPYYDNILQLTLWLDACRPLSVPRAWLHSTKSETEENGWVSCLGEKPKVSWVKTEYYAQLPLIIGC